jgi:ATP-dependent DNA helicase PIF1
MLIPVDTNSNSLRKPSPKVVKELQQRFKDLKLLIIDEFSMIGKNLLVSLDRRLRQATGKEEVMGGVNVVFSGDLQQLPPVCDTALYVKPSVENSNKLYADENSCILKDVMRIEDERLRSLLHRCAIGELTVEDWRLLQQTRAPDKVRGEEFDSALRLYPDRESVKNFNTEKLNRLRNPILKILAEHNHKDAKKASSDLAMGLQAEVFLAKGARVMITSNICVERGAHNGSLGTVHSILLDPSKPVGGLPVVVIVKLDKFEVKKIFPDETNCVPILPKLASWNDGTGR